MATSVEILACYPCFSSFGLARKVRKENYGRNASCSVCIMGSENDSVLQLGWGMFGMACCTDDKRAVNVRSNLCRIESLNPTANLTWCYIAQHKQQERVQRGGWQDFLSAVLITHAWPCVMNGIRLVFIFLQGGNRW